MTTRRIALAWPARKNHENPYNRKLGEALEALDWEWREFSPKGLLIAPFDVLHVHWPEGVIRKRGTGPLGLAAGLAMVAALGYARWIRRRPVIWTVHNLQPHGIDPRSRTVRLFYALLPRVVTGTIYLTQATRDLAITTIPGVSGHPSAVVPHGRYDHEYVPTLTPDEAREAWGVTAEARVIGFLGTLHRYKGALELVRAFRGLEGDQWRLIIFGACRDDTYRDEVRAEIAEDPRIQWRDEFASNDDLANAVAACDLVAYPYTQILNSGSVMVPLELNRPVLAPNMGSLPELAATVGAPWVSLFTPPLRPEHLARAASPFDAEGPDLTSFEWDAVARGHDQFYRALGRL